MKLKESALDATDIEIMKVLTYNSRTSYSSLATSLTLTVNTVKNRFRKILASKAIANFLTVPNFAIFGFSNSIILIIRHEGNSEEIAQRISNFGEIHMKIDHLENISAFRLLFKGKSPTSEQLKELIKPGQIVWVISQEQHSDFMPSETDWILIYWLLLEPRIRVNDLAKKASVTEKTVSRRLEAMSKKHVLEFSVQFNPAAMSNYLYFRIMVMIDQSLRDNIIRQINMISDGHFMYIVPPTSESALFFILFARNPPELEAVTNKLRSLKGVFRVGSYTPLKAQIYHKLLLDEISKKVAIPGKRRVPLVLEGA